jgi:hypothetical protein
MFDYLRSGARKGGRPKPRRPIRREGLGGTGSAKARRIRRDDSRHALPSPDLDGDAYLLECRKRMNTALTDYAAIEGRIRELYAYWVERMGDDWEGWIQLRHPQTGDIEAKQLFSLRENSRERVRTYASIIQAELALRGAGLA